MCDDRDEILLSMRVLLFLPVVLSGEEDEVAWLEIVDASHSDRQGVELESLVPSTQHEPKVLAKVVDALAHESTAVLCEQNHRTAGAKKRVESELDDANWGGWGERGEGGRVQLTRKDGSSLSCLPASTHPSHSHSLSSSRT